MQTIERIVSTVNRRVDESNPMVDARLPSGERVNVIIPPLSLTGPTLTIRRFPRAYTLHELIALGTLDEHMLLAARPADPGPLQHDRLRRHRAPARPPSSTRSPGSSPTASASSPSRTPPNSSSSSSTCIRLETRPPNVEGKGQITIRDLVRNSLRMRPDRIIVGEVRGGETLDMLQAMSTGHDGSLATVHANSAEDALMRLQTLASMSEVEVPFEALQRPDQLARSTSSSSSPGSPTAPAGSRRSPCSPRTAATPSGSPPSPASTRRAA